MMSTTNKVFIDSSIFVEAFKGNKVDFYTHLISDINNELFINEVVLSEYLFYVLAITAGTSPKTLQEKKEIHEVLKSISIEALIPKDTFLLPGSDLYFDVVPKYMIKYNLLPNDATILATCKLHNITHLASHDTDFIVPCKEEGIELLSENRNNKR